MQMSKIKLLNIIEKKRVETMITLLKKNRNRWLNFFCMVIFLFVFSASFIAAAEPETEPASEPAVESLQFRKGPYLIFNGKNTQMKILWQLNQKSVCSIIWGTDPSCSRGDAKSKEMNKDHLHVFTLKRLKPQTRYYYKITADTIEKTGSFFTAPKKKAKKLKFFVYGDTRSFPYIHDEIANSINLAYLKDPSWQTFSLFVGDMVTQGGEKSSWDNEIFGIANANLRQMMTSLPILACVGNHEMVTKDSDVLDKNFTLFKKYFPYPFVKKTYWSFDYGPAHFVILDQYDDAFETKQLKWLQKDLENTKKFWKFVCFHEPGWSAGADSELDRPNNESVQKLLQPLFEKHQVTAAFAGHNHYYARALVNGVYHITTGGGGAPLYDPKPYAPNVMTTFKSYHYCIVEINDNTLVFKSVKPDGTVIDTFTLNVSEK